MVAERETRFLKQVVTYHAYSFALLNVEKIE